MKMVLLAGLFTSLCVLPALAAGESGTAPSPAQPGVIWDRATTILGPAPYRDPSDVIRGTVIHGPASQAITAPNDSNSVIHGTEPLPPDAPRPDRPLGVG